MAERAKGRKAKRRANGNASSKPRQPAIGHNSNVPDEVYRRWLPKIEVAENAYAKAADIAKSKKGELASVYKAAEQDGCHRDAIKRARRLDKRDHADVAREYAETGRVLSLMGSKLAQLDLFVDIKQPEPVNPYLAGQQVGREAGSIDECPYDPGTEPFDLWHQGYASGQEKNHDSLRQASA
jgi:hypothetical protein